MGYGVEHWVRADLGEGWAFARQQIYSANTDERTDWHFLFSELLYFFALTPHPDGRR